ncbi:MAG: MerR family transcriptional regulator [Acidimicrobiales bacterium]
MGERSYLSIGDVLALLRAEFPDVTISKIRFLESRGLLVPERTPSGYRKFYDHDVDRLRWILRQQREHFLPLKVIKGRLEGAETARAPESLFDSGELPPEALRRSPATRQAQTTAATALANGVAGNPSGSDELSRRRTNVATIPRSPELEESLVGSGASSHPSTSPLERALERQPGLPPSAGGPGDLGSSAREGDEALAASPESAADQARVAPSPPSEQWRSRAEGDPALEAAPKAAGGLEVTSEHGATRRESPPVARKPPLSGEAADDTRSSDTHRRTERARGGSPSADSAELSSDLAGATLTVGELAHASGLSVALVEQLESFGLIVGRTVAGVHSFDEEALAIARLAASFAEFGVEARHLRIFKHAAERQAGLYSQIVLPLLRQRNPEARRRSLTELSTLTELGAAIQAGFSRAALRELTGR